MVHRSHSYLNLLAELTLLTRRSGRRCLASPWTPSAATQASAALRCHYLGFTHYLSSVITGKRLAIALRPGGALVVHSMQSGQVPQLAPSLMMYQQATLLLNHSSKLLIFIIVIIIIIIIIMTRYRSTASTCPNGPKSTGQIRTCRCCARSPSSYRQATFLNN